MKEKLPGRSRVVAWIVGVTAAGIMVLFSLIAVAGNVNVQRSIDDALTQEVGEVEAFAASGIDPTTGEPFTSAERFIEIFLSRQVVEPAELIVGGIQGQGLIAEQVGANAHSFSQLDERTRVQIATPGSSGTMVDSGQGKLTWRSISINHKDATGTIALVVFHEEANAELHSQLLLLAGASLTVLVATGLAAWYISGQILSYHGRFNRAVEQAIDSKDLVLPEDGPENYVSLAVSANRLVEASELALDEERRFTEDVTFAVRTPLAMIEAGLSQPSENPEQDTQKRRELASEARQLNQLVEDLSLLTRISRGDYIAPRTEMDVAHLIFGTAAMWQAELAETDSDISVECGRLDSATVQLDEARLRQALDRLIENAVDASRYPAITNKTGTDDTFEQPGKEKKIFLQTALFTRDGDAWVAIEINDFGRGIPSGEREKILDRFTRASNDPHPGNGLGMAIADQIARAMGGRVEVPEQLGQSTVVRLSLPVWEAEETN